MLLWGGVTRKVMLLRNGGALTWISLMREVISSTFRSNAGRARSVWNCLRIGGNEVQDPYAVLSRKSCL